MTDTYRTLVISQGHSATLIYNHTPHVATVQDANVYDMTSLMGVGKYGGDTGVGSQQGGLCPIPPYTHIVGETQ